VALKEQLIIVGGDLFEFMQIICKLNKSMCIQGYGGLRGAIAFSLAYTLVPETIPGRNTFLGATYFVILFTGRKRFLK
jgi:hypothetical protein